MESSPKQSSPELSSDESTDSNKETKKKSKSRSFRAPLSELAPKPREETEEKTTPATLEGSKKPSLDKDEAAKDPNNDESAQSSNDHETARADAEQPVETLTDEERIYATAAIAEDHLEHIDDQTDEAEQDDATISFLQKLQNGMEVEIAFREAAAEHDVTVEQATETEQTTTDQDAEVTNDEPVQRFETTDIDEPDRATPQPSSGQGGGGGVPPTSGGASTSGAAMPPGPPQSPLVNAHNVMPIPAASPAVEQVQTQNYSERRRGRAGDVLLGGIIGYLVGRRRGRIKTERKMRPIQQKLEKQVTALEQDITVKEQKLRHATAEQQHTPRQESAVRPVPESAAQSNERATPQANRSERLQPSRVETRLKAEKPQSAEQIGHMLVAAEAPTAQEKKISAKAAPESAATMARTDLLEMSDTITVEGASLRKIYESRLISEKQLRRLVAEHLQGKDISKSLRHEMVEHEIDFERDPMLRDRVRSHLQNDGGGTGLGKLLKDVGIVSEDTDPVMQKRIEQAEAQARHAEKRKRQTQRVADVSLAAVIATLGATILVLLLR